MTFSLYGRKHQQGRRNKPTASNYLYILYYILIVFPLCNFPSDLPLAFSTLKTFLNHFTHIIFLSLQGLGWQWIPLTLDSVSACIPSLPTFFTLNPPPCFGCAFGKCGIRINCHYWASFYYSDLRVQLSNEVWFFYHTQTESIVFCPKTSLHANKMKQN